MILPLKTILNAKIFSKRLFLLMTDDLLKFHISWGWLMDTNACMTCLKLIMRRPWRS